MSIDAIRDRAPSNVNFERYEEALAGIPEEILRIIFCATPLKEQVALSRTAKQFYAITRPLIRKTIIAQHAFGKVHWRRFFGDVGLEPPLPADIVEILNGPCPFWAGKKVHETHLLTLVPKTVEGQPLTLDYLGELIQQPRQGTGCRYVYYIDAFKRQNGSIPVEASHWVLMTKDVIPNSKGKTDEEQQQLLAKLDNRYAVPILLDAATSILMAYLATQKRLYSEEPWTYTRCHEEFCGYRSIIGRFNPSGLYITCSLPQGYGIAVWRKL